MDILSSNAVSALLCRLDALLQANHSPEQKLVRLEQPLPATHLLGWLASQRQGLSKAYWYGKDGDFAIAGLGVAWKYKLSSRTEISQAFGKARKLLSGLSARHAKCLSYFSFSDNPSQVWPEFGFGQIFLPLIEVTQTRKGCSIACHLVLDSRSPWRERVLQLKGELQQLIWSQKISPLACPRMGEGSYVPDRVSWSNIMASAFQEFTRGLDKVVLSRQAELPQKGLSPWLLMQSWQHSSAHSYCFAFEGDPGAVFLGCSPERLFKRQGNIVQTEALAGTARRSENIIEEMEIEARLMTDSKNIHENRLVLNDILSRLTPLCSALESDRSHSVLKLKNLLHLRYLIRGVIKPGVRDEQLLLALHPTPAVGGTPRDKAMNFINDNESYSRGLYAGACGIIGSDITELNVSIRSALFKPHSISLYSGAGIVRGSSAESEWRELDNKIATVQGILANLQRTLSCEEVDEFSHQAS